MAVKGVSLDVWGTLLNPYELYKVIALKLSRLAGGDPEDLYGKLVEGRREARRARLRGELDADVVGGTLRIVAASAGVHVEVLKKAIAMAIAESRGEGIVIDGALDVLVELKRRGYLVAALGNVLSWPGACTRVLLARTGLLEHLDVTMFSDEIGARKPQRRAFEAVASALGLSLEEVIHVGDSLAEDFAGALMAGAYAALVDPEAREVLRVGGRGFVIPSLRGLLTILPPL